MQPTYLKRIKATYTFKIEKDTDGKGYIEINDVKISIQK